MKTDENNPEDWYRSAKVRLGSADRLYPLEGSSESVVELLQESAERFLKGYLISKGWTLSRVHDLGALIAEAQKYDEGFGEYADFADELRINSGRCIIRVGNLMGRWWIFRNCARGWSE